MFRSSRSRSTVCTYMDIKYHTDFYENKIISTVVLMSPSILMTNNIPAQLINYLIFSLIHILDHTDHF